MTVPQTPVTEALHTSFSILTPTLGCVPGLYACVASVERAAAGTTCTVHHHIQNGGGPDLGVHAVRTPTFRRTVRHEADAGMYDALNRAYAASEGDLIGHLNSDEQLLPGTLDFVARFFAAHPEADVLFGGVVVVNPAGDYMCSRVPQTPRVLHTRLCHLATFTAAMFLRRRFLDSLGMYYDASYRTAADADLVCRMLRQGARMRTTRTTLALFVDSGHNLALSPAAREEQSRLAATVPAVLRAMRPLVSALHRVRKLAGGAYALPRFSYPFLGDDGSERTVEVTQPTGRWVRQRF